MNWKKYFGLLVAGGIALVLLLAATVMLFRFKSGHSRVNQDLEAALSRLQQLNNRNPYPSSENIALMEKNLDAVQDGASDLQDKLQSGQLSAETIEPAEFVTLLERMAKRLTSHAESQGVTLPERFTFGFSRYAAGELPAPADIPRLVTQLKAGEVIISLLFQSRISELISMERDIFDGPAAQAAEVAEGRRGGRRGTVAVNEGGKLPAAETNELYSVERFRVSFAGRETAVWDALNAIARATAFLKIVDVRLENQAAAGGLIGKKQPPTAVGGEKAVPGVVAQYPSHDERVVAGRELVKADLVLDLYRFAAPPQEEASP